MKSRGDMVECDGLGCVNRASSKTLWKSWLVLQWTKRHDHKKRICHFCSQQCLTGWLVYL